LPATPGLYNLKRDAQWTKPHLHHLPFQQQGLCYGQGGLSSLMHCWLSAELLLLLKQMNDYKIIPLLATMPIAAGIFIGYYWRDKNSPDPVLA
jgi:hypothetical protein